MPWTEVAHLMCTKVSQLMCTTADNIDQWILDFELHYVFSYTKKITATVTFNQLLYILQDTMLFLLVTGMMHFTLICLTTIDILFNWYAIGAQITVNFAVNCNDWAHRQWTFNQSNNEQFNCAGADLHVD